MKGKNYWMKNEMYELGNKRVERKSFWEKETNRVRKWVEIQKERKQNAGERERKN